MFKNKVIISQMIYELRQGGNSQQTGRKEGKGAFILDPTGSLSIITHFI